MAKNEKNMGIHIVWTLSEDGIRPSQTPYGFIAKNPVQRAVPPGGSMNVRLHVAANHPMLAFPARTVADSVKILGREGVQVLNAGEELTVTIVNESKHLPLVIDDDESLVHLHPLSFSGTSEVG